MHRIALILALVGPLAAPPVLAAERLSLYADAAMTDCSLEDQTVGLTYVYVGHESVLGAASSQFRVRTPNCWTGASFVSSAAAPGFDAVGDVETDMIVSYGGCYGGAFLVATITYYSTAQDNCCWIYLEKGSSAPLEGIVTVDCASRPRVITWSFPVLINENSGCLCSNPVHATTWGGVKALYR